jgi:ketosteroid isomerase-like protein
VSNELQRIEEEWATAVAERDVEAAREILAEDFVLTSSGGVSEHMPRDEWLAALPALDTRSLECTDVFARELGEVAVVRARLRWEASMGDRDLTGEYLVADVFKREGGSWKASWRISTRIT